MVMIHVLRVVIVPNVDIVTMVATAGYVMEVPLKLEKAVLVVLKAIQIKIITPHLKGIGIR
jgi:hypothetical protein